MANTFEQTQTLYFQAQEHIRLATKALEELNSAPPSHLVILERNAEVADDWDYAPVSKATTPLNARLDMYKFRLRAVTRNAK
jgi:hypothetical protein